MHGKLSKAYNIAVGIPEEKRPLGRHRRRWDDNIRWILGRQGGNECVLDSSRSEQGHVTGY